MSEVIKLPEPDELSHLRAVKVDDIVQEIKRLLTEQTIPAIYRNQVLSDRTRRYELKAGIKSGPVEILHTLLGIELKVGRRRLLCPDLATVRYLAVFARIGVETVAIPYDITRVSRIADELESVWQKMMLLIEHLTAQRSERLKSMVRTRLIAEIREEIVKAGAGDRVPKFNQTTRQRR